MRIQERVPEIDREKIATGITGSSFDRWYREREATRNIRQGRQYFNGPGSVPTPERHSPSNLLQCHRKIRYRQENAPAERTSPTGIYWFGTRFEEDIALPYLQERVTGEDTYACNSLWIDCVAETDAGDLQIRGETDPVIVDETGTPLVVTEIKTKQSIDGIEEPNRHHRAQVHAYMWGLSQKHDQPVTDAVVLYGSRTKLDVASFHVEFDPEFWTETVLEWATQHTTYRLDGELPPATPEFGWECEFCAYRERCGRGDGPHENAIPEGLLPLWTDYPRQKVVEYLRAHDGAKLTPALAQEYPDLVEDFDAYNWECEACNESYGWETIDWSGSYRTPPHCPSCADEGIPAVLRGPPVEQQSSTEETVDAK